MVSKNELKLITSLRQKKYRDREGLFIAEGPKIIEDFLNAGASLEKVYALPGHFEDSPLSITIDAKALKKMSGLKTPNSALAIFKKFNNSKPSASGLTLCLDDIQDPGNLGTIIRLSDWFGINGIVCSPQTVDCYNPKVVQATMGSLARVPLMYTDLAGFLDESTLPVYGGFMQGDAVYAKQLPEDAILVMGNEGNGISEEIEALVQQKISIPNMGSGQTESLNVATATAILLSEFKRTTGR
ncbi:MAG: RNA methyltransferase [Gilvibacter sp.]